MPSPRTRESRRLRTSISGTELRIWSRLRRRGLDRWKFRRQQPIGPYYVDFYCPAARLVIEVDGPTHDDTQWAYDLRREAWVGAGGYKGVRLTVPPVDQDGGAALDTIEGAPEEPGPIGVGRQALR